MNIEVWSDIVCPFCYIGKRSLELALEQFEHRDEVQIEWRSFQLDPDSAKPAAASVNELIAAKYGTSIESAQKKHDDLAEQGAKLGLTYRFDLAIPTNSHDAHRLIQLAKRNGVTDAVVERLFAAYFGEGADIADAETLVTLGAEAGMDAGEIRTLLASDELSDQVSRDVAEGLSLGLNGVPFFALDRLAGLAGAQPPAVLLEALSLVHANQDTD